MKNEKKLIWKTSSLYHNDTRIAIVQPRFHWNTVEVCANETSLISKSFNDLRTIVTMK